VDLLVIGGTKAGMPPTEAIVLFDKSAVAPLRRPAETGRAAHLQGPLLSAPWIGMLETGAWIGGADHANAMARRLAEQDRPALPAHPSRQANAVSWRWTSPRCGRLRDGGWFVYRFLDGSVRMMCSWATTPEAVDEFAAAVAQAS
jgi:threonine aldolase